MRVISIFLGCIADGCQRCMAGWRQAFFNPWCYRAIRVVCLQAPSGLGAPAAVLHFRAAPGPRSGRTPLSAQERHWRGRACASALQPGKRHGHDFMRHGQRQAALITSAGDYVEVSPDSRFMAAGNPFRWPLSPECRRNPSGAAQRYPATRHPHHWYCGWCELLWVG